MDADKTVTANFAVINYDLTVVANPAGGGTTNPAVGVHPYAYGSVVNVTAAPLTGYAFSSWSGACTGTGGCSVTMDGDKTVTANFVTVKRQRGVGGHTVQCYAGGRPADCGHYRHRYVRRQFA